MQQKLISALAGARRGADHCRYLLPCSIGPIDIAGELATLPVGQTALAVAGMAGILAGGVSASYAALRRARPAGTCGRQTACFVEASKVQR